MSKNVSNSNLTTKNTDIPPPQSSTEQQAYICHL